MRAEDQGGWSSKALLLIVAAILIIAAAVVVPLVLTGKGKTIATRPTEPVHTCSQAECGEVQKVLSSPRTITFYGASCSGTHGPWFLNVVEGGPNNSLRPSYTLNWTFPKRSSLAFPSGQVSVSPGSGSAISMTLQQGALTLTGTGAGNTAVSGSGTLAVQLAGSSSSPELRVTETGLSSQESSLGLISPFDINGAPAVLHVKLVPHLSGC